MYYPILHYNTYHISHNALTIQHKTILYTTSNQGECMRTTGKPSQTTVNFSIRINKQLKTDCETLYHSLGMNLTTAIQVFLKQSLEYGGIPFEVRLPASKRENYEAWLEAQEISRDSNRRGFPVEQALAELKK